MSMPRLSVIPLWGNRYCAGGGDFTMRGAALLSANGPREWNQKLTRRGHLLVMEEIEPAREPGEERAQRDHCGANGSLDGTFFPVRGSKRATGIRSASSRENQSRD